jgi:hypothetical protein
MITFLDVETTFQINPDNRRSDPSPFHKDNKLVSVQYATGGDEPVFKWFYHQDMDVDPRVNHAAVQNTLHNTKLLVGHNIKFDLMWLWEESFAKEERFSGRLYQ